MGALLMAFINKIISLAGGLISVLLLLLPSSPFTWDTSGLDSTFLKILLWIIPVPSIILSMEAIVSAVLIYYGIRVAMRWIKLTGN